MCLKKFMHYRVQVSSYTADVYRISYCQRCKNTVEFLCQSV